MRGSAVWQSVTQPCACGWKHCIIYSETVGIVKKSLHLDKDTVETDVLLLESQIHIKTHTHLNQSTNHSPIKKNFGGFLWDLMKFNSNMVYL